VTNSDVVEEAMLAPLSVAHR